VQDVLSQAVLEILAVVLSAIVSFVAVMAGRFLDRLAKTKEGEKAFALIKLKKELAIGAVQYAEEKFRNLKGPEKYRQAFQWLSERFCQYGLDIDPDDLDGLIHDALMDLRNEFGREWGHHKAAF